MAAPEQYSKNVSVRLTPSQYAKISQAAEAQGRRITGFLRHGALLLADSILAAVPQGNTNRPKVQAGLAPLPSPTPRGQGAEASPENSSASA